MRFWVVKMEIWKLKEFLCYLLENYDSLHKGNFREETFIEGFFVNHFFVESVGKSLEQFSTFWGDFSKGYQMSDLNTKLDSLIQVSKHVKAEYRNV